MAEPEELFFSAARDPIPTYILLAITGTALLLSILASIVDIAVGRESQRVLTEGVATNTYTRSDPSLTSKKTNDHKNHTNDTTVYDLRKKNRSAAAKPEPTTTSFAIPPEEHEEHAEKKKPERDDMPVSLEAGRVPMKKRRTRSRRAIVCTMLARLLFSATVLGSAALGVYLLMDTFRKGALSTIASEKTNEWTHALMRKSVSEYAREVNRKDLLSEDLRLGVGRYAFTPGKVAEGDIWRWIIVILVLLVYSLLGGLLGLVKDFLPPTKLVAIIMIAQVIIWICISLVVTFTYPTKLPYDGTPLPNHWLDRSYMAMTAAGYEDRLIGNFYIKFPSSGDDDDNTINLVDLPGFSESFCKQFSDVVPNYAANADSSKENQTSIMSTSNAATKTNRMEGEREAGTSRITVPRLPLKLYNEVFLVYVIGKPIGTDHFRAIAYMGLAALTGAPIVLAHMFRTYILYPFAAIWVGIVGVLSILATPSVLRIISAPKRDAQIITFCQMKYRLLVVDETTSTIARLDFVIFGVTALVVLLQALRWLRDADGRKDDLNISKKHASSLNYEDVYSGSGSLRW